MRWLGLMVLQMSVAYAFVDAVWQSRWTILVAGLVGGTAAVLVGVLWLRVGGDGRAIERSVTQRAVAREDRK